MKQLAEHESPASVELFDDRVRTGIRGLDPLIEGGLPRASMTVLAGSPGSGKTIASAQFLHYGAAEVGCYSVYVSFSERKNVFTANMKRFGMDFAELEKRGKFKFLDFATTKANGISMTLKSMLDETLTFKAGRLVVDSFTAMATAFEKKIEARVVLHAFEKLMRQAACTTLLLVEIPTGSPHLGLGFEEFVADGLILFETIEDEVGIRKRAIIRKMRGTDHNQNYSKIVIDERGVSLTPYVTWDSRNEEILLACQCGLNQILVEAVQEGISTMCASAAHSILFFLKNSGSIKSESDIRSVEALSEGLGGIFGYGSKIIEKEILKILYTKLQQPLVEIPRDFDFAEQVERAFKLHETSYKMLALQSGARRS